MKKIYPLDLTLAIIAIMLVTGSYVFNTRERPQESYSYPLAIDTSSYVTLGNSSAPLHLILLEEFSCQGCKLFHEEVMPILIDEYIEKEQLKLTIIPLAYLDASKEAYMTSQCIQEKEPSLYLSFLNMIYDMPQEKMLKLKMKSLFTIFYNDHREFNISEAIQHSKTNTSLDSMPNKTIEIIQKLFHNEDIEVPALILNGKKIEYTNSKNFLKQLNRELQLQ